MQLRRAPQWGQQALEQLRNEVILYGALYAWNIKHYGSFLSLLPEKQKKTPLGQGPLADLQDPTSRPYAI